MELFDKDAEPVVQSPPPGKFSSMNVQWQYLRLSNSPYPVQQVCHIPYDRVTDFIRGESDNPEHPTTFRIYSSRRRRRHSKTTATTFRTYSEELTYWCVYGPDTKPRKHKKATSAETKRTRPRVTPSQFQKGCGCHFIVHRLVLLPDAARISYVHPHHTNNEDLVCHAVDLDRLRLGLGVVAPWLSLEIKRWVVAFISAGFTLQQVFDRHVRALHERRQRNLSYEISRDDFLTPKDVSNIAKHLACLRQEVDNEDALSVRLWCLLNKQDVFIYQEQRAEENVHFILGLQTDWQLELMLKLGHGRLIAMNSTLGPHNYKLCLNTIIVFDQHQNAIPVACIITSSAGPTFKQWLQELHKRVLSINSDWKPSAFVIDAAAVDVDVIRSVLNLPSVQLSLWRVRRCWLKHLIQKVKGWSVRAAMLNVLGQIMDITKRSGQGAMQRHRPLVNEFMTQFCDQEEFMAYFRDHWQKKIDMWVWAAQTSIHTNQEVNAALESFYCTLKQQFLKGKDNIQGRSIDWLFHILTTEVAPFFWYQHHARENNIRKPAALPEIEESSIARAFKIPDSDVQHSRNANFPGLGVAHVRSQSRKEVWYEVFNAQSGWACCTCDWAGKGNICKHQLKVTLIEGAPVSSMAPSSNGMADDNFPTNGTLQSELTILEQDAYHETHLPTLLLRENAHQAPCDGLEEDIQRLQQQTLQLAGGNFSLLQLLRDDMMRTQQILLEARSGPLDVIPQASTHFGTL
ncbi:hypothetical protein KP509_25G075900 [Ceratopteris richardii]|uniref:SWIM-type domain-containing protein n=1 Tax=Ceratopteris richardii TaxID=49495 RepID=A0A8T2RSL2_CERRI|nr:hypothetical protein KP509_25G075900 [Ceratopteris richardii]